MNSSKGEVPEPQKAQPGERECGDIRTYRAGCRCTLCKKANAEKSVKNRRARTKRIATGVDLDKVPHGLYGYDNWGCRCEICCADKAQKNRSVEDQLKENYQSAYEASRAKAHRHGMAWTGPELEIVARPELTKAQVAAMLGRTTYAVHNMRRKLATEDPRTVFLAGLAESGEQ